VVTKTLHVAGAMRKLEIGERDIQVGIFAGIKPMLLTMGNGHRKLSSYSLPSVSCSVCTTIVRSE
jgi:hypothetical protein